MLKIQRLKIQNKKSLVIALICAVVLAIGGFWLYRIRQNPKDSNQTTTAQSPTDKLNLSPPTTEEKQAAQDSKQQIVQRDEQIKNTPTENGLKKVTPIITYAGKYGSNIEVGGYTPEVFENSGTCTATFTKDNSSFDKSVAAVQNVNSMDCPVISVPVTDFKSTGSWSVVLKYSSSTASGISASKLIEVNP